MSINTSVSPASTRAKMDIQSKKRLLEHIAQAFDDGFEGINKDTLFEKLCERERLGSTGIGEGIAIPHCRFDTQGKTLCVCITLESPIDFDANDTKPVDVAFAMLVPLHADDQHLENLAHIAQIMRDEKNIALLRAASSDTQLFETLSKTSPPLI